MSDKILSFCVYGSEDLYNIGAYENIAEAEEFFPGWTCRFYCEAKSPILSKLLKEQKLGRCEVVIYDDSGGISGMFERLCAISDLEAEFILIRDADQRVSDKDYQSVKKWIESDKTAIRQHEDSSQTGLKLMGCAWGIRGGVIKNINRLMVNWLNEHKGYSVGESKFGGGPEKKNQTGEDRVRLYYGADQVFLEEVVWPLIKDSCMTFGPLGEPFPPHKSNKWDDEMMFRRIKPGTECKEIFGGRPDFAYQGENNY